MNANLTLYSFRLLPDASYVYGDPNNDRCFVMDDIHIEGTIDMMDARLKLSSASDWQDYLFNVYQFMVAHFNSNSWGQNSMFKAERDANGQLTGVFHVWVDADVVFPQGRDLKTSFADFRVIPFGKANGSFNKDGIKFSDITATPPKPCKVEPKPQQNY